VSSETTHFYPERREFIRVCVALPVKYKFLSHEPGFPSDEILEGSTDNLSGGGLKLLGPVPNLDWLAGLLSRRIAVGVNIFLPGQARAVKALTRTLWVEGLQKRAQSCLLGLRFREISREDRERIVQFIIKSQMP